MPQRKSESSHWRTRYAAQSPHRVRIARDVPEVSTITLHLSLAPPVPTLKCRLLGRPRSGFKFTTAERAIITSAAPSLPVTDWHRIPIIDVKLAYLVEDYIERIKTAAQGENFKPASRDLAAIVNPKKSRPRKRAQISQRVVHLLAARLLLRTGETNLRRKFIAPIVDGIRCGEISDADMRRAGREIRALGALRTDHALLQGRYSNEPFRILTSHVINEWRLGLRREPELSRDPSRHDGDDDAVYSELVRLTHALDVIAFWRLWKDKDFRELMANDPPVIMTRAEVYYSMKRTLRAMRANDVDSSGRYFSIVHRPNGKPTAIINSAERNLRRLHRAAVRFKRIARRWLVLGRRPRRSRRV